ncbi:hypothetical protein E2C01_071415 [Portunus trituberculatus]|uniref:Uncharacterized protein n=1 Tax=Portunus trituberculatus TaxID=210409 RepID=A0A5B7I7Y4_PORTR|nr:hypothetical protein [Portunus trituberculatus]
MSDGAGDNCRAGDLGTHVATGVGRAHWAQEGGHGGG